MNPPKARISPRSLLHRVAIWAAIRTGDEPWIPDRDVPGGKRHRQVLVFPGAEGAVDFLNRLADEAVRARMELVAYLGDEGEGRSQVRLSEHSTQHAVETPGSTGYYRVAREDQIRAAVRNWSNSATSARNVLTIHDDQRGSIVDMAGYLEPGRQAGVIVTPAAGRLGGQLETLLLSYTVAATAADRRLQRGVVTPFELAQELANQRIADIEIKAAETARNGTLFAAFLGLVAGAVSAVLTQLLGIGPG